jgi:Na+/melibiose symporter-like transporter
LTDQVKKALRVIILNKNSSRQIDKLWNNQFILINVIALLCFFAEYIMTTTVPLYAVKLGGDESTAGVFMSIISITALIARPILGHTLDTRSRKIVVIIGVLALATAGLFYGIAQSIPFVLILAAIQGIAISALTTAAPTVLVDVAPPSRLAEGVSIQTHIQCLVWHSNGSACLDRTDQLRKKEGQTQPRIWPRSAETGHQEII